MFWTKKAWWKSVFEVTKRERTGLISLVLLLIFLGWVTQRYRKYEQREAVSWSVQQLPQAKAPTNIQKPPQHAAWGESDLYTKNQTNQRVHGERNSYRAWKRSPYFSDQSAFAKRRNGIPSQRGADQNYFRENNGQFNQRAKVRYRSIDVNEADSLDWLQLPGIGPLYTRRILRFRSKLGGFVDLQQIRETYGLPDSTFQQIRPYLEMHARPQPRLNPNTADLETLSAHPYISQSLARHIIAFREQHGGFQRVEDLRQLRLMSDSIWEKISPYIIIN